MPAALLVGALIAGGLLFGIWQQRSAPVPSTSAVDAGPAQTDTGRAADAPPPEPSRSVGTPANGSLTGAVPLPYVGTGYEVLTAHQGRDLSWGTQELVDLVVELGAATAARGRTLHVGNLSAREGGPIRQSKSHQSGRDVDFAFCYQDDDGKAAAPPDFVRLDRRAEAKHLGLRLDAECTWNLVLAAMAYEAAPVQHIFLSSAVEKKLIAHARASGVAPETIKRASLLMTQPRASEKHDDHMHVRIACPPGSDDCADRSQFKGGHRFHEPTE